MKDSIWTSNLSSLEKYHPTIKNKIDKINEDENPFHISVNPSKDGNFTLLVQKENLRLQLSSRYNPIAEAQKWVEEAGIKDNSTIIVFGMGLGYHISQILLRMTKTNKVFIIEPSIHIFKEALRHIDMRNIFERENVFLLIDFEDIQIKKYLNGSIQPIEVNSIIFASLQNYTKLFLDNYKNLANSIKELIYSKKLDANTGDIFAEEWQKNLIKNIPFIIKSYHIKHFFDIFSDKPAVVVSAGPSLVKNVKLLKTIKNKAVIICVDTALRVLLKEDIIPDFVMSVDGCQANKKHFDNVNYDNIPLIYTSIANSKVLNNHDGKKIFFAFDRSYIDDLLHRYNKSVQYLRTGGSVACSALDFAIKMKANPIIFIGQDLAYTDNQSHAIGTAYHKNTLIDEKTPFVEDIHGNLISTGYDLLAYLLWFQDVITEHGDRINFIDATEGGAKIKGTEIMPLSEVIDKYCQKDTATSSMIEDIFQKNREDFFNQIQRKELITELTEIFKCFKEVGEISSKAVKLSEELYRLCRHNLSNHKVNHIVKQLDKHDKEIMRFKNSFRFLTYVIKPIFGERANKSNADMESESSKGTKIAEDSIAFYKKINNVVREYQQDIMECVEVLQKDLI